MPARQSVQAEKEWRAHVTKTEHYCVNVEDGSVPELLPKRAYVQLYKGSKLKKSEGE